MHGDLRNNEDVVVGTILICFIPAYALFNSRSSHTFIFTYFASQMNKESGPLRYKLAVSQLMSKGIVCLIIYQNCDVYINNTVISTDLIPRHREFRCYIWDGLAIHEWGYDQLVG